MDQALSAGGKQSQAADDAIKLVEGSVFVEIQFDTLLREWHQIADTFKQENKINLFTLMTSNAPKLVENNTIEVIVENKIQQELLMLSKPDIVNLLRVRLNNYAVNIVGVMSEADIARKPYTDMEKYQAMSSKNPVLDQLREKFQLGME